MCKAFEVNDKRKKFYYVHINHGIRKNSTQESKRVKKILKNNTYFLKILNNKKKLLKIFNIMLEK